GRLEAVVSDTDVPDAPGEALYLAFRRRDRRLAERILFLARDLQGPAARALRGRGAVGLSKPLALRELVSALPGVAPGGRAAGGTKDLSDRGCGRQPR